MSQLPSEILKSNQDCGIDLLYCQHVSSQVIWWLKCMRVMILKFKVKIHITWGSSIIVKIFTSAYNHTLFQNPRQNIWQCNIYSMTQEMKLSFSKNMFNFDSDMIISIYIWYSFIHHSKIIFNISFVHEDVQFHTSILASNRIKD